MKQKKILLGCYIAVLVISLTGPSPPYGESAYAGDGSAQENAAEALHENQGNDIVRTAQSAPPKEEYTIAGTEVMSLIENKRLIGDDRIEETIQKELTEVSASSDYFWAGDVHSYRFSYGSDTCLIQFCPYFEGTIVNVPSESGSAEWSSALKVAESVLINGELEEDIDNIFPIKNIRFKIAAGVNTLFTSAVLGGMCMDRNVETPLETSGMLGTVSDSISDVNRIYHWITDTDSYIGQEKEQRLSLVFGKDIRAFRYTFSQDIELTDSGHFIFVNSWAACMGDSDCGTADRVCGISWEFDVYRDSEPVRTYRAREYVGYYVH